MLTDANSLFEATDEFIWLGYTSEKTYYLIATYTSQIIHIRNSFLVTCEIKCGDVIPEEFAWEVLELRAKIGGPIKSTDKVAFLPNNEMWQEKALVSLLLLSSVVTGGGGGGEQQSTPLESFLEWDAKGMKLGLWISGWDYFVVIKWLDQI